MKRLIAILVLSLLAGCPAQQATPSAQAGGESREDRMKAADAAEAAALAAEKALQERAATSAPVGEVDTGPAEVDAQPAAPPAAAGKTPDRPEDCDLAAGGQSQMNACSAAQFMAADRRLNELYRTQTDYLSAGSRSMLRSAQRDWLKYRDATCAYETAWPDGRCSGTICPLQANLCLKRLTDQRIADMERFVNCRDNGCPW